MKQIPSLICLIFLLSINVNGQNSLNDLNVIFKHDFENNTPGTYLVSEWKKDWLYPAWSNRQSSTNIVQDANDATNPTKSLQINFPAGTVGADENGASWYTYFDKVNEIYVSYDIMFMPGFQYKLGGKIPSVQGGEPSANIKPNGYDGFTGGLMFKEDGRVNFYVYFPDSREPNYGDSFRWGGEYSSSALLPSSVVAEFSSDEKAYCTPGKWYNITYRMVLNTLKQGGGGNYDGILEAYFDGKLLLQLSHFLFRHTDDLGIDCMRIYSFFGGSGDDWRTPINEWLRIDNVVLYTFNENIDVPRGNVLSPKD
ncbi:MAG: hypothetical protein JXB49_32180, partial [Bacteroidales bacterium]|nr:hypothetical protein [Bacteroidales bacterium]